jgi:hypothetical protein
MSPVREVQPRNKISDTGLGPARLSPLINKLFSMEFQFCPRVTFKNNRLKGIVSRDWTGQNGLLMKDQKSLGFPEHIFNAI